MEKFSQAKNYSTNYIKKVHVMHCICTSMDFFVCSQKHAGRKLWEMKKKKQNFMAFCRYMTLT